MKFLLVALTMFYGSVSAQAYLGWEERPQQMWDADVVAEVDVSHIQEIQPSDSHDYLSFKTEVTISNPKFWKGVAPLDRTFTIPIMGTSIYPGRYLVFLRRNDGILFLNTFYLSARRITGDQVEWMRDDNFRMTELRLLEDVRAEIKTRFDATQTLQARTRTLRRLHQARKQRAVSSALWLRGENRSVRWPLHLRPLAPRESRLHLSGSFSEAGFFDCFGPRDGFKLQPEPRRDALLSRLNRNWD